MAVDFPCNFSFWVFVLLGRGPCDYRSLRHVGFLRALPLVKFRVDADRNPKVRRVEEVGRFRVHRTRISVRKSPNEITPETCEPSGGVYCTICYCDRGDWQSKQEGYIIISTRDVIVVCVGVQ